MRFSNLLIFAAGAAIGSVVTWKMVKDKYARIAQEEIDSVKIAFEKNYCDVQERYAQHYEQMEKELERKDYVNIVNELKYAEKQEVKHDPWVQEEDRTTFPRIITPDELGQYEHYKIVTLTYFNDEGILCDDTGNEYDVDETIGDEAIHHFGEWEDNVVHVRNNEMKTDFEVVLEEDDKYSEVFNKRV